MITEIRIHDYIEQNRTQIAAKSKQLTRQYNRGFLSEKELERMKSRLYSDAMNEAYAQIRDICQEQHIAWDAAEWVDIRRQIMDACGLEGTDIDYLSSIEYDELTDGGLYIYRDRLYGIENIPSPEESVGSTVLLTFQLNKSIVDYRLKIDQAERIEDGWIQYKGYGSFPGYVGGQDLEYTAPKRRRGRFSIRSVINSRMIRFGKNRNNNSYGSRRSEYFQ